MESHRQSRRPTRLHCQRSVTAVRAINSKISCRPWQTHSAVSRAEYLAVSIIAVRERHESDISCGRASRTLIKSQLPPKSTCAGPGSQISSRFAFSRLDGTAFLHVALDNAVTPGIAMFLHETLIDSLSGMVLLSPMFLVFVQPLLDDGLEGIQFGWLLLETSGCGEKSSCARYLRIVLGSAPVFLEISLIRYPQLLKSLI